MRLLFISFLFSFVTLAQNSTDSCEIYIPYIVTVKCGSIIQNDYLLEVQSNCTPTSYSIQVFNHWGELVFKSNSITDWFDMKNLPVETYAYLIKVDFGEGEQNLTGAVTLLK